VGNQVINNFESTFYTREDGTIGMKEQNGTIIKGVTLRTEVVGGIKTLTGEIDYDIEMVIDEATNIINKEEDLSKEVYLGGTFNINSGYFTYFQRSNGTYGLMNYNNTEVTNVDLTLSRKKVGDKIFLIAKATV
jgi:uncharacterized protein YqgQ